MARDKRAAEADRRQEEAKARYQRRMAFAADWGGAPGYVEGQKERPAGAYADTDAERHEAQRGGPPAP